MFKRLIYVEILLVYAEQESTVLHIDMLTI